VLLQGFIGKNAKIRIFRSVWLHSVSVSNYERCVEPSLSCDTVSTVNLMCCHSPFGECDAVGISSGVPHVMLAEAEAIIISDEQGFGNPCRYTGKGTAGTGRGKNLWTLAEPLPSVRVTGYLHSSSMGRVSK